METKMKKLGLKEENAEWVGWKIIRGKIGAGPLSSKQICSEKEIRKKEERSTGLCG